MSDQQSSIPCTEILRRLSRLSMEQLLVPEDSLGITMQDLVSCLKQSLEMMEKQQDNTEKTTTLVDPMTPNEDETP